MGSPLNIDEAIRILREAIDRACSKCESYLIAKKIDTCCWVLLNEVGAVFREYGYPEYDVKLKITKTIGYRTKDVLQTIQQKEEIRKSIENILMEELFDYHGENIK
jgi:hypothetical protein